MSFPGQSSSSPVAGQIVVVRDRFVEEDGDVMKGNTGCLSESGLTRARQVISRSSSKAKRKLFGRRSKSRDGGTRSGGGEGEGGGGDGGRGDRFRCVSCVRRPKTLGWPVESVTSDPNDPEFSYAMMRELLQKNEFFSAECSTNLDAAYYMCDHGK